MKLWKISQDVNDNYESFDSAIVAAESECEAQHIQPTLNTDRAADPKWEWAPPDAVKVEYIGEAKEGTQKGVVLASFNAG